MKKMMILIVLVAAMFLIAGCGMAEESAKEIDPAKEAAKKETVNFAGKAGEYTDECKKTCPYENWIGDAWCDDGSPESYDPSVNCFTEACNWDEKDGQVDCPNNKKTSEPGSAEPQQEEPSNNNGYCETLEEASQKVIANQWTVRLLYVNATNAKFSVKSAQPFLDVTTPLLIEGSVYALEDSLTIRPYDIVYQEYAGGVHKSSFCLEGPSNQASAAGGSQNHICGISDVGDREDTDFTNQDGVMVSYMDNDGVKIQVNGIDTPLLKKGETHKFGSLEVKLNDFTHQSYAGGAHTANYCITNKAKLGSCWETDNVLDYPNKGTLTTPSGSKFTDWCVESVDYPYAAEGVTEFGAIYEYYCFEDGENSGSVVEPCAFGCVDGVCNNFACKEMLEGESYKLNNGKYEATLTFVDETHSKWNVNGFVTPKMKAGEKIKLPDGTYFTSKNHFFQAYAGGVHQATACVTGDKSGVEVKQITCPEGMVGDEMNEGESKSHMRHGKEYKVSLDFVSSDKVEFSVNSAKTGKLSVNGEKVVDSNKNVKIQVKEIAYQDYAGGVHQTTYCFG